MSLVTRRNFMWTGSLWVATVAVGFDAGCGKEPTKPAEPPASAPRAPYGYADPEPPRPVPAVCNATERNIEGPYYRAGAPMRDDLTEPGIPGTRLVVTGRVFTSDCTTPIAGATLDVWSADGDGHYDNDQHDRASNGRGPTRLRGKLATNASGAYRFRSVIPGHYLNGENYRPAHVHVKVSAPGHATLTTQLYFEGDPYNKIDPFIRSSLIMRVGQTNDAKSASYDFVLVRD